MDAIVENVVASTKKHRWAKTCADAVSIASRKPVYVKIGSANYPIPSDVAAKTFAATSNRIQENIGEPSDIHMAWDAICHIASAGRYKIQLVLTKQSWDAMKRIANESRI